MINYIIILLVAAIIMLIAFDIKIKQLKNIKQIGYSQELNKITNKLPNNIEICKEFLEKLNNENVKVEESVDKKNKTSLYIVISNKIIIANIKDTFTRIQTIAHECVHSIQNKKMLMFNFIFTNIYTLYFLIICIFSLCNIEIFMQAQSTLLAILIVSGVVRICCKKFFRNRCNDKSILYFKRIYK